MKMPPVPRLARRPKQPPGEPPQATEQARWVRAQDLTSTATRWLTWTAVLCGPLAIAMAVTGFGMPSTTPVKARPSVTIDAGQQAAAGELARQCVLTWLQAKRGEETTLSSCFRSDDLQLPAVQPYLATDAAVARIVDTAAPPTGPEPKSAGATTPSPPTTPKSGPTSKKGTPVKAYAVTIAVTVRGVQEPQSAAVRRYFALSVVFVGDAARAAALPSEVAAPPVAPDPTLGYRYRLTTNHPASTAVQQFLGALAAGDGDVSRYVTPGTVIRPITPAPYKAVTLTEIASDKDLGTETRAPADGLRARILATASMRIDDTRSVRTQYALTLASRGGRWEVAALDPAPVLPQTTGTSPRLSISIPAAPSTTPSTTPSAPATAPVVPTVSTPNTPVPLPGSTK